MLQRRLGFTARDSSVIDLSAYNHYANLQETVRWSPFLDWFSMRTMLCLNPGTGPLTTHVMKRFLTLVLLPHALRAADNQQSGIHQILLTSPPVSSIAVMLPRKDRYSQSSARASLVNSRGVTIGEVLKKWSQMTDSRDRGAPVCLYLGLNGQWVQADYPHRAACRSMHNLLEAWIPKGITCFYGYSTTRTELARKWYQNTVEEAGDRWFGMSMEEQSKFVREILLEWKDLIRRSKAAKREGNELALWPVLALNADKDSRKKRIACPYEVDFACGVVFCGKD